MPDVLHPHEDDNIAQKGSKSTGDIGKTPQL